jgi:hypothetical protein
MARAETLVRLGREPEARKDWERMAALGADQTHAELRSLRTLGLAHLGDHAGATAEVEAMTTVGKEPVYSEYNNACVYSLSMRAVRDDTALPVEERKRLAEQYGERAVALLTKMRVNKFFQSSGAVEYLKTDTDMNPLKEREDFQHLLKELEGEVRPPRP